MVGAKVQRTPQAVKAYWDGVSAGYGSCDGNGDDRDHEAVGAVLFLHWFRNQ